MPRENPISVFVYNADFYLFGGIRRIRYIKESPNDDNPLYVAKDLAEIISARCRSRFISSRMKNIKRHKICVERPVPMGQIFVGDLENPNLKLISLSDMNTTKEEIINHISFCDECQIPFERIDPPSGDDPDSSDNDDPDSSGNDDDPLLPPRNIGNPIERASTRRRSDLSDDDVLNFTQHLKKPKIEANSEVEEFPCVVAGQGCEKNAMKDSVFCEDHLEAYLDENGEYVV